MTVGMLETLRYCMYRIETVFVVFLKATAYILEDISYDALL